MSKFIGMEWKHAKPYYESLHLQKLTVRSCPASWSFVRQQRHVVDESANGGRVGAERETRFTASFGGARCYVPRFSVAHQIQNWEIIAILVPFSARITRVVGSKLTWFCSGYDNVPHPEINRTACFVAGVPL